MRFASNPAEIFIEKGIPFPPKNKGGGKKDAEWDDFFQRVGEGDSFLAGAWLAAAAKKNAERRGITIVSQTVPDTLGFRLWIVQKPIYRE